MSYSPFYRLYRPGDLVVFAVDLNSGQKGTIGLVVSEFDDNGKNYDVLVGTEVVKVHTFWLSDSETLNDD